MENNQMTPEVPGDTTQRMKAMRSNLEKTFSAISVNMKGNCGDLSLHEPYLFIQRLQQIQVTPPNVIVGDPKP